MKLQVFAGTSSMALADKIAHSIQNQLARRGKEWNRYRRENPLGKIHIQPFPSGERFCQFEDNIRGNDVFLVQALNAPVNDNIMELCVMADAAKRASAGRITAVLPYMSYMRQDRKDKPRVPISAKMLMNILEAAGIERYLSIDIHSLQAQAFTDRPFDHLFASPIFLHHFRDNYPDCRDWIVMSPDAGGIKRAEAWAESLGSGFGFIAKKRKDAESVQAEAIIGDVAGHDVIIVDDMTESLGTLIESAKKIREAGANKIRVAVTHAVVTESGYLKLISAIESGLIEEFFTTNTTTNLDNGKHLLNMWPKIKVLDVSELFAKAIICTYQNESVTDLFDIKGF